MPKIVINEYDKTKAGLGEYANFTVFVPGHAKDYPTDEHNNSRTITDMDGNKVVEITSQEKFKEIIGIVPSNIEHIDAVKPILSSFGKVEGQDVWSKMIADPNDFFKGEYAGKLYIRTAWAAGATKKDGKLKLASNFIPIDPETGTPEAAISDTDGTYELATTYSSTTTYFYIEPQNIGSDEENTNPQMGNQIAYELLGLGYTVLYRVIEKPDSQGTDDLTDYDTFWKPYEDKANYDFRYVITGFCGEDYDGTYTQAVDNCVSKLASTRGDCIALIDVPRSLYADKTLAGCKDSVISFVNSLDKADKNTAIFMPTITYNGTFSEYNNHNEFPAYFHYLVCASNAFINYPEWFAVAGYTRGISPDFTIKSTAINLGDSASEVFEPRCTSTSNPITKAVNIVAKIRGAYYLWGNRTAYTLGQAGDPINGDLKASHFLNIRQLCTTLKKELYIACRKFTFDPNSDTLWVNFVNAISPLLDKMKANQGIEDYRIIKVPTNTKAKLIAKVRIVPIEAVEDFEINLFLEDSITGANVEIDEGTVSSGQ